MTIFLNWIESVAFNPKLIKTDSVALYDFIEPSTNSERKQSLKLMVDSIETKAMLERLKFFGTAEFFAPDFNIFAGISEFAKELNMPEQYPCKFYQKRNIS